MTSINFEHDDTKYEITHEDRDLIEHDVQQEQQDEQQSNDWWVA